MTGPAGRAARNATRRRRGAGRDRAGGDRTGGPTPVVVGVEDAAATTDPDMDALTRTIAMVNDKGGVGKTSLVANLAGQFAAAGYRCLLVDLNRQANLADDLGFRDGPIDDHGAGLLMSIVAGSPLRPGSTT